jgi:hypothetical protein
MGAILKSETPIAEVSASKWVQSYVGVQEPLANHDFFLRGACAVLHSGFAWHYACGVLHRQHVRFDRSVFTKKISVPSGRIERARLAQLALVCRR